mgnify:CR=1 FL=1
MKYFLGVLSVIVTAVILLSVQNTGKNPIEEKLATNYNNVLDRFVVLGSKTIYLEENWDKLKADKRREKFDNVAGDFNSFYFLIPYIKDQYPNTKFINIDQNIEDAFQGAQQNGLRVKLNNMRFNIESMYRLLAREGYDDDDLFASIELSLREISSNTSQAKKVYLINGIVKALKPFKRLGLIQNDKWLAEINKLLYKPNTLSKEEDHRSMQSTVHKGLVEIKQNLDSFRKE